MSPSPSSDEMREYGLAHMVDHMLAADKSEAEIEKKLSELPDTEEKSHLIDQFLKKLPADQRAEVSKRLRPSLTQ